MPVFVIQRQITYSAYIEAPAADLAVAEAKEWSESDWAGDRDDDTYSLGVASAGSRPDFTMDLKGREHDHDFDDEDTGGCIYCDAPPSTQERPDV